MIRLNPDCVRDILLYCEDNCTFTESAEFASGAPLTVDGRSYEWDVLAYHLRQCELTGYFYRAEHDMCGTYYVADLAPVAHEFLANIRRQDNWEKVKATAAKVGSASLSALSSIAAEVIGAAVRAALGLP